ncbi:hypothetical protein ONZ45_g16140 [Pleurotus djamor]|nr:hypothetical protein ONZ45_g16140 [Pleurotus djamor]
MSFKARETSSSLDLYRRQSLHGILHLWLRCHLNFAPLQNDRLEYYADPLLTKLTDPQSAPMAFYEPSIYIRYNGVSQESTVLIMDYAPLYGALRRACEYASRDSEGHPTNPFMILIWYLSCLISSTQTACAEWMTVLNRFAMVVLQQNVTQMRQEHRRLASVFPWQSDSGFVEATLKSMEHNVGALAQEVRSYENAVAGHIEILLGLSQLQNGIRMRTMAEDNQKQAIATQAIARDTKRDSEVMKTITVVTLIYLPATFVCTLLSMGIFEWSGDEGEGLKIAKMGWIFLAIAVPLSAITCCLAFAWLWHANRRTKEWEVVDEEAGRHVVDNGPKWLNLRGMISGGKNHSSRKID